MSFELYTFQPQTLPPNRIKDHPKASRQAQFTANKKPQYKALTIKRLHLVLKPQTLFPLKSTYLSY